MDTISTYLTKDHRDCDEVFASLENAVADNNWDLTNTLFIDFHTDLNHHFSMEETIMFPAFEEKSSFFGFFMYFSRFSLKNRHNLRASILFNSASLLNFQGFFLKVSILKSSHDFVFKYCIVGIPPAATKILFPINH